MPQSSSKLAGILRSLEKFYGRVKPPRAILSSITGRADPYGLILYANCGYPATHAACTKGFEILRREIGLPPQQILDAPKAAPVAAVPSNCLDVPLRLGFGQASKNWAASYRSAQEAIAAELPEDSSARLRAYLLLNHHGQEICKRTRPLCEQCPVSAECAYFQARR